MPTTVHQPITALTTLSVLLVSAGLTTSWTPGPGPHSNQAPDLLVGNPVTPTLTTTGRNFTAFGGMILGPATAPPGTGRLAWLLAAT